MAVEFLPRDTRVADTKELPIGRVRPFSFLEAGDTQIIATSPHSDSAPKSFSGAGFFHDCILCERILCERDRGNQEEAIAARWIGNGLRNLRIGPPDWDPTGALFRSVTAAVPLMIDRRFICRV
jgi:hypothetical protein